MDAHSEELAAAADTAADYKWLQDRALLSLPIVADNVAETEWPPPVLRQVVERLLYYCCCDESAAAACADVDADVVHDMDYDDVDVVDDDAFAAAVVAAD